MDINLLITYGAAVIRYKKNSMIFRQNDKARYYFQLLEGQVKVFNLGPNGKEFVQGIYPAGDSFGEPPLFTRDVHPANAIATQNSVVLKLSAKTFFQILDEYPAIQRRFLDLFARRMYEQSLAARMLNTTSPELRILEFLTTFKKKLSLEDNKILIPFTRQELANLTGLRVETVIRTLTKLNKNHKVEILNRKLYF